ncbi:hypothetical protein T265_12090 [Opisthorchis viverrini]|uniref:BHLH domain-containing protein n=1 Tax=Opisthorchis viverrini TaxID=6198 RepID=A0A074Z6S4_OPIVI|nr:hypothetical protein T265_12090 [Opisthorchis viverrini]KER18940.1 hypothetical protein T265_12090 [Opisthorchis viverrini]
MQQRINRCRTRRLEILNEVRQITNEMFDRLKRGLPTPNELKATFQRLADLLEELKSLDD